MNFIDMIVRILLGVMLFLCCLKDIKTKSVSMIIIIPCFIILIICLPFRSDISMINGFLGSFVGLGMIGVGKVSNWQVGMGDGIILILTGIGLGIWENAFLLIYALVCISLFSIILLFMKKVSKKTTLPFVPFLFLGYLAVILS